MKKLVISFIFTSVMFCSYSQVAELRKFRFGIKAQPSLNWYSSTSYTLIDNSGSSIKFGYGIITEFGLFKFMSFVTGLELSQNGGTLKYDNTSKDIVYYIPEGETFKFFVSTRQYKIKYLELPVSFKIKLPELGSRITLFTQLGSNLSFRLNANANDIGGYENQMQRDIHQPTLNISKDTKFMQLGVNVGIGAEIKIAGPVSAFALANFRSGITNSLLNNSSTLQNLTTTTFLQDVKSQFISLSVGFLF